MQVDALRSLLHAEGKLALCIRVIPKSSCTAWAGSMADGALKVKLAAVPEKGKANDELVRFLASELGVPQRQVEIVSGATGRLKQVRVNRVP
ncbi:MAG: DUF167 domain-containing protein [Acidobacteria bacterium]|nr:DUF167 domain-containing protein [Acidobacteriota bacterium]